MSYLFLPPPVNSVHVDQDHRCSLLLNVICVIGLIRKQIPRAFLLRPLSEMESIDLFAISNVKLVPTKHRQRGEAFFTHGTTNLVFPRGLNQKSEGRLRLAWRTLKILYNRLA